MTDTRPLKPSMKLMRSLAAAGMLPIALLAGAAMASPQIATRAGCVACHAVQHRRLGPAFKEIAARYQGQADAVAVLSQRVRHGSSGQWGPVAMVPTEAARLSDADLKAVVTWILKTPPGP